MVDMHLMYGLAHCNSRQARRLYQEHFPHRQLPTHKMFSSIHRRLSETGTFKSGKVGRSGRPRTTCTAELEEGVLDEIVNHPGRSTRELALDFGGVTYPSIIAVWSRWAPPQERARLVTIAFSGGFFSFLVNPPVCRFIAYTLDWSFIFYITGILGLIWCAVWLTVVKDKPEDDPHISTEELKYLRDNLDCGPNDSVPKHIVYPWDEFVKSMPVWAIVVAHACTNYCFYSLVVGIPWFLRDTHNYQLDSTGLLSLLPYLMITVLMPVAGVLADWLRNAELLTTTHVNWKLCVALILL
ncbi:hypothetical protein J6590_099157 [Homalodisca vitripennis]|nr:hypothetical protein J6590_099157 [Homalodisca vitripennis]